MSSPPLTSRSMRPKRPAAAETCSVPLVEVSDPRIETKPHEVAFVWGQCDNLRNSPLRCRSTCWLQVRCWRKSTASIPQILRRSQGHFATTPNAYDPTSRMWADTSLRLWRMEKRCSERGLKVPCSISITAPTPLSQVPTQLHTAPSSAWGLVRSTYGVSSE